MSAFKDVDPQYLNVAKFLRSSASGVKTFEGVMADRRVEVFRGSHAINALSAKESPYHKLRSVPSVASKVDGHKVLQECLEAGLFVRARSINNSRFLQPDLARTWSDDALYVWVYQGSQLFNLLAALGIIALAIAVLMYPMWPLPLRNASWYVVMLGFVFLGLLVVIGVVRIIVFVITIYAVPPGIWIFPNLWEDCSVIESFKPLWAWHAPKKSD